MSSDLHLREPWGKGSLLHLPLAHSLSTLPEDSAWTRGTPQRQVLLPFVLGSTASCRLGVIYRWQGCRTETELGKKGNNGWKDGSEFDLQAYVKPDMAVRAKGWSRVAP